MTARMYKMLKNLPVYPRQEMFFEFCTRYRVTIPSIPTDCPIGEYNGLVCWPDQRTKDRYLAKYRWRFDEC